MLINDNYCSRNLNRLVEYFKVNQRSVDKTIIEQHLYCLGLLESFSKIGMNFVLSGDMAVYLMCNDNFYLPNSLEIRVNHQDYLEDYLKEADKLFKAINYHKVYIDKDVVIFEYIFLSFNRKSVKIYLNVKLEDHITTNVMSVAISKPYLINCERIYRVKTPSYEEMFAQALFDFRPYIVKENILDNGNYPLFIIKRLVDMAALYPLLENFYFVISYYINLCEKNNNDLCNVLYSHNIYEAYNSMINIFCQGKYRPEHYGIFKKGIVEIQRFCINEELMINKIYRLTAYPLLACACIYQYKDCLSEIIMPHKKMHFYNYSKINLMRNIDKKCYDIVYQAIEIFDRLDVIDNI